MTIIEEIVAARIVERMSLGYPFRLPAGSERKPIAELYRRGSR